MITILSIAHIFLFCGFVWIFWCDDNEVMQHDNLLILYNRPKFLRRKSTNIICLTVFIYFNVVPIDSIWGLCIIWSCFLPRRRRYSMELMSVFLIALLDSNSFRMYRWKSPWDSYTHISEIKSFIAVYSSGEEWPHIALGRWNWTGFKMMRNSCANFGFSSNCSEITSIEYKHLDLKPIRSDKTGMNFVKTRKHEPSITTKSENNEWIEGRIYFVNFLNVAAGAAILKFD